jgi:hypothetical protein
MSSGQYKNQQLPANVDVDRDGQPLTPEYQALLRIMRDPRASHDLRMAVASVLAPIMHKPIPVRYVSPEKAQRKLAEALRK